jgi:iduronate 2-sulfatase
MKVHGMLFFRCPFIDCSGDIGVLCSATMRQPLLFAVFFFLALPFSANSTATAADIDVFLLAGQSNMDGRGKTSELDAALQASMTNTQIWYRNPPADTAAWKPLAPGFSIPPKHKDGLPGPTFGPELGFARALLVAQPQQLLGFIKGSKGGTSIEQWSPGTAGDTTTHGSCYRDFMDTIKMATAALSQQGHKLTIRALLWHQGEANAQDTTEVYQTKLAHFITRIRADLTLPTLPVFVGEVIDNGKRDSVRAAQRAIPQLVDQVYFVNSDGLTSNDNGTHFDTKSQLELGQRFASAWLQSVK